MKSKITCNVLIVLFQLVCLFVSIISAINKLTWACVVIPLSFACAILLMYQSVIYKGRKNKLLAQIPWENIPTLLSKGHVVTVGSNTTTITPQSSNGVNT